MPQRELTILGVGVLEDVTDGGESLPSSKTEPSSFSIRLGTYDQDPPRTRLVRFDEATAVALRGWKAAQAADKLQFGPAYRNDGGLGVEAPWLVTEPIGYVAPETFLGRWQRLVKAAGVPAIGIHGARHSFASLSLEAAVRVDIVSGQLGHSNVATTASIYARVSEAAAVEAAEKLGQILEGEAR
jgi:integrase